MRLKDLLKAFGLFIILALLGNSIATFIVTDLIPFGFFVAMIVLWSVTFTIGVFRAINQSKVDVLLNPFLLFILFLFVWILSITGVTVAPGANEITVIDGGQNRRIIVDSTEIYAPYDKKISRISFERKEKVSFKVGDEKLEFEVILDPTNSTVKNIGKLLEKGERNKLVKLLDEKMERIKELENH